jgi:hypothetical protein
MTRRIRCLSILGLLFPVLACGTPGLTVTPPVPATRSLPTPSVRLSPKRRLESIPPENLKITPEADYWPPEAGSGWSEPVPIDGPINTAGGEDSPFVTPDGSAMYFFFTPDIRIPASRQILDGVTGIWVSRIADGAWTEPERVWLEEPGELAMDGCEMVIGDRMYFCSIRASHPDGIEWYYATWRNGAWGDVASAGTWMNQTVEVGELHIATGYREIYFASRMAGGSGGFDLWMAPATDDGWGEPVNLGPQVNSTGDENQPFVTEDGQELWFTAASKQGKPGPSVFQCRRQEDASWGDCREVLSSFAGEPTLTGDGRTLYFIHHFFSKDMQQVIEADIYVTHRL